MVVFYRRNFSIGHSTHVVELYQSYTKAQGVEGFIARRESTRMADCLKDLPLSKAQVEAVKRAGRERSDGIFAENGTYFGTY